MNRRRWLLAGALLLALAGSVALLRTGGGARGEAAQARADAAPQGRAGAELAASGAEGDPVEQAPAGAAGREAVAETAAGYVFRFVSAETGEPVPDVDLWFVSTAQSSRLPRAFDAAAARAGDEEERIAAAGRHLRGDAEGTARLADVSVYSYGVARSGELAARVWFSVETDWPRIVEMVRAPEVVVLVVDRAGAPLAGVPVALELRAADRDGRDLDVIRRTGADGRATFRSLALDAADKLDGRHRGFASLAFPVRTPVDVEFDPRKPPDGTDPIRFVAPPTGSVEIRAVDERDTPLTALWVHLKAEGFISSSGRAAPRRYSAYLSAESALFTHVEVGMQLAASADAPERERVATSFDGPTRPGELVRVVLRCAERSPTLVGRLLGPDGAPLASVDFEGRSTYPGAVDDTIAIRGRTDPAGAFRVPLRRPRGEVKTARAELSVPAPPDGRPLLAERALPVPLPAGEIDLGDVTLAGAPVIFAGRVVDAAGEPVYWMMADLAVICRQDSGPYVCGWPMRATSDHDGRFACYGRVPDGEYALSVFGQGYLRSPFVRLRLGDEHVEVVVRRPGSIAGALVLGEGVPASWFRIVADGPAARPADDLPTETNRVEVTPRLGGEFALDGLRPGEVDVRIELAGGGAVLVVEDVRVHDGAETRDPRLAAIDLSKLLGLFRLSVRAPDGSAPPRGLVLVRAPGDEAIERALEILDGELVFAAAHGAVDVDVLVPGYRAARIDGLRGAREIVLEPGIEVTLRLAAGVDLPPDPVELRMGLVPRVLSESWDLEVATAAGEPASFQFYELANLPVVGPSRQVTVVLPWKGSFAPKLYLHSRAEAGGGAGFWPDGYPWRELGPEDAGSVIDVVLDAEQYAKDVATQLTY